VNKIGLTATPFRKDNTHFHLKGLFGPTIVEAERVGTRAIVHKVNTLNTFHFTETSDYITALTKLSSNKVFASIVAKRIEKDFFNKRRIIVLSPRIEHLTLIAERLRALGIPCGRLVSETNRQDIRDNETVLSLLGEPSGVILGTYQLVGTGFDNPIMDCMHLPYSYNNKGLFIQLVGRIERFVPDKPVPIFVEYVFNYDGYTKDQQINRLKYQKSLGYEVVNEVV